MFPRVFGWLRRHRWLVDLMLMLPVGAISLLVRGRYVTTTPDGLPRMVGLPVHLTLVAVMCLPLIWRRRRPREVFAFVAAAALVQWLAGVNVAAFDFAILIAMYTVAVHCRFRWALGALAVVQLGVVLMIWRAAVQDPPQYEWGAAVPFATTIGIVWVLGLYVSIRHKYTLSLEERAKRLERERDAKAEAAVAAERARISREMHDVLAHSISVMVIQSDSASHVVDTDAARAKQAMKTIGTTGRQALTETRRVLGVLRDGGDTDRAPLASQPGVDQIPDLIQQMRAAGIGVELAVGGESVPLPAGLGLGVYRIVQEALTNVMKHAGPTAAAHVALHYGGKALDVRIRDNGPGATPTDGLGHGLVGMRERAAVYGGRVDAGPAPGGGFEVHAWLPVRVEDTPDTGPPAPGTS